jgi:ParB family transcriptional regulator, chromosome partitioning protein
MRNGLTYIEDASAMSTAKKKGLGRGLDALLGGGRGDADTAGAGGVENGGDSTALKTELPLDQIERSRYQPRREFDPDTLRELADSIAAQGVLQPIVVRPIGDGRHEIIAGERRWRAAQQAGLQRIPVVVREVDEQAAIAIALIENIQRDDLNPLEEAGALFRLLGEFGLTHQQVAEAVGKSRTTVTNLLRLLELNDDVKRYLYEGRLEMGHARALLGLKDAPQSEAARQVVARGLSVRETEKLVRRLQNSEDAPAGKPGQRELDPDVRRLRDDLAERLGARVDIKHGSRGTGKLVIAYNSVDELEGILAHIQ